MSTNIAALIASAQADAQQFVTSVTEEVRVAKREAADQFARDLRRSAAVARVEFRSMVDQVAPVKVDILEKDGTEELEKEKGRLFDLLEKKEDAIVKEASFLEVLRKHKLVVDKQYALVNNAATSTIYHAVVAILEEKGVKKDHAEFDAWFDATRAKLLSEKATVQALVEMADKLSHQRDVIVRFLRAREENMFAWALTLRETVRELENDFRLVVKHDEYPEIAFALAELPEEGEKKFVKGRKYVAYAFIAKEYRTFRSTKGMEDKVEHVDEKYAQLKVQVKELIKSARKG